MEKTCNQCGLTMPFDKFYRSSNILDGYENKCKVCRNSNRKIHTVKCETCKNDFETARMKTRFCSHKCMGAPRRRRVTVVCSYCGDDKEVVPSLVERLSDHYCNQNCRTKHLKEIMVGENNPNYTSEIRPCDGCGKMIKVKPFRKDNYNFCTYKCYQSNIGQYFSGENNWNYNPNLTEEERIVGRDYPEYQVWRTAVFERDNFTCQSCFDDTGGNLIGHHILNYTANPDLRTEVNNGITLCKDCHIEFHNVFGYTNNTYKQLKSYLNKQASY